MRAADLSRHSALDGHVAPGLRGAMESGGAGVILREQCPAAIVQVAAASDDLNLKALLPVPGIKALPPNGRAVSGKHATVMWSGPGQWLMAFHAGASPDVLRSVGTALKNTSAAVVDLGHARTVIRVSGSQAVDVLLKGCPLDLETFAADDCAASLLGHVSVQIHCLENNCFDVYVFRSFGRAMWDWLTDAALEFGVELQSRVGIE